jgi:hypothetical protein
MGIAIFFKGATFLPLLGFFYANNYRRSRKLGANPKGGIGLKNRL